MTDPEHQTNENQQVVTTPTTRQILKPTIFYKESIQHLKQMRLKEIDKTEIEFIELKDNFLPTGLTSLEDMFDSNDVPKKPKLQPINTEIK